MGTLVTTLRSVRCCEGGDVGLEMDEESDEVSNQPADRPIASTGPSHVAWCGFERSRFNEAAGGCVQHVDETPCNRHLRDLAEHVKQGVRQAGGTPIGVNAIAVSDGITMGTPGMRASLASREVIADSVEMAVGAHDFDGAVALAGCDKTIPGTLMGLARPEFTEFGGLWWLHHVRSFSGP